MDGYYLKRIQQLSLPKCTHHDLVCYIKTGMKEGPTKDLSFFICSNQSSPCNFYKLIPDFKPTICLKHLKKNELQAVVGVDRLSDRKRWFYRCSVGKTESNGWCGRKPIPSTSINLDLATKSHGSADKKEVVSDEPQSVDSNAQGDHQQDSIELITIASDSEDDNQAKGSQRKQLNDVSNMATHLSSIANTVDKLKSKAILISPQRAAPSIKASNHKVWSVSHISAITKDTISMLHHSLENRPPPDAQLSDPDGLTVTLLKHQKEALAWLRWRESQQPSGGILADDMGLGKTLTMIAFILMMKKHTLHELKPSSDVPFGGTLIVCPASLIHQWKKEVDKRVKPLQLSINLFHGQGRTKNVNQLMRYDIVITSYSTIANEWKVYQDSSGTEKESKWLNKDTAHAKKRETSICLINWSRIIMDEAHVIKNPKSMTSIAVCGLKAQSRWAVTGTPIQNETGDFYSLIKFLRCSPFDNHNIWRRTVEAKSKNSQDRLNTLVKTLLLRRTKNQKIDGKPLLVLPECSHITHKFKLNEAERKVYDILHHISKKMLQIFLRSKQSDSQSASEMIGLSSITPEATVLGMQPLELLKMLNLDSKQSNSTSILVMVLRLRQCCSHLSMMYNPLENDTLTDDYDINVVEMMQNMSIDSRDNVSNPRSQLIPDEFKISYRSTKIKSLLDSIREARQTDSNVHCVVVSQWTKMLTIVKQHLQLLELRIESIDGQVAMKKRSEIVENFNSKTSSIDVLLVSLKAGGVGLNLVGANHLFLIDQHWNPALEAQACDRIYRVGQQKNVWIHRFLCEETVEEKVVALQNKKRELADSIVSAEKTSAKKLTFEDLRTMFGV